MFAANFNSQNRSLSSLTRQEESSIRTRLWQDIPDTSQYSKIVEWEYNLDIGLQQPRKRLLSQANTRRGRSPERTDKPRKVV